MHVSVPNSSALRTVGSVMVVGGGVAGVQAALDLTELGLKVYLVEKSGAIGIVMARLDKTFPTNDCSLCILAPKLMEAGRDPNIAIMTKSELIARFFMDVRTHGKGFDATRERAIAEGNFRVISARPPRWRMCPTAGKAQSGSRSGQGSQ